MDEKKALYDEAMLAVHTQVLLAIIETHPDRERLIQRMEYNLTQLARIQSLHSVRENRDPDLANLIEEQSRSIVLLARGS
ncbi:hypothetical protein V3390_09325 [Luteimonas sp. FXH3W]|uniref:Uncharacterized protein n=1 Tax=Aquilutibacter rugosus TaxID=3115820 RepID=A0ABU7V143_9GAMM